MPIFNVGDVVVLKSGGPKMTVKYSSLKDDQNSCICVWFDTQHKAEPFEARFKNDSLIKVA